MSSQKLDTIDGISYYVVKTDTNYSNSNFLGTTNEDADDFVHESEIIENLYVDRTDPKHRLMVSLLNEYAGAAIYKVADAITREEISITKPLKDNTDNDPKPHTNAINGWREFELQTVIKQFIEEHRLHGRGVYYYPKKSFKAAYSNLPRFRVLSDDEVKVYETDKKGAILNFTAQYKYLAETQTLEKIPYTEFVFYDSCLNDDKRIRALDRAWNKLLAMEAVGNHNEAFLQRMGNGFLIIGIPEVNDETAVKKIDDKIADARVNKGVSILQSEDNQVTAQWMTAAGRSSFVETLQDIKEDIATAFQLPKRWLIGDPKGALSAASEDGRATMLELQNIAQTYKKLAKMLLIFHGVIENEKEVDIDFNITLNVSEEEQANLALTQASTIATKQTWLTKDEMRDEDGYEPMTDEQMDEMNMLQNMVNKAFEGDEETGNQEQKEEVKTDSVEDFFMNNSIRDISKMWNIAPGTASKIRAEFDAARNPKERDFEYTVKTDSISISNNIVEMDGYLIAPSDDLPYPDHVEVQTADEIRKWWEADTPKELFLGIDLTGTHNGSEEVRKSLSIGTVKAVGIDTEGRILSKYRYDLSKVDKMLGPDNYIRKALKEGKPINSSVGLWTKEKRRNGKVYRTDLDIRSAVFGEHARNKRTYAV